MIDHYGFEIPAESSEDCKHVLKQLFRKGVVVWEYDDGPALLVNKELITIAGRIGLNAWQEPYRTILMSDEGLMNFRVPSNDHSKVEVSTEGNVTYHQIFSEPLTLCVETGPKGVALTSYLEFMTREDATKLMACLQSAIDSL